MNNNWLELSPEEKRRQRLAKWLSPSNIEFVSAEAEQAYKKRVNRFIKVINMEEPDRVPVVLPAGFFPVYYNGGTLKSVMYDYDELRRAWHKYIDEFDMDTCDSPGLAYPGRVLEDSGYKLFKWPGHGLPDDSTSYQYVEGEYMKADEYDALINNPADYMLRVYMPRVLGIMLPFQQMATLTPLMSIPIPHLAGLGRPEMQTALQSLMDVSRETAAWQQVVIECSRRAKERGFPSLRGGGIAEAPFDVIGDRLRGTQGIFMDMYRQPDKLLESLEIMVPMLVNSAVASANASGCPLIMLPLHKGDDAFMSGKQYEEFYWPTLRKVLMGLIEEGIVPLIFAEGKYNTRLEIVGDLPRASSVWWFDQTDIARAKEVLGDNNCIAGNIPASVLCTGTPAEVKECCRGLLEAAGKGGGYILTGATSIDNGNAENLRAIMAAAREYGRYR